MEMRQDFEHSIVQQADAANRAMTSLFHIVHHRRPVAGPFRWATTHHEHSNRTSIEA